MAAIVYVQTVEKGRQVVISDLPMAVGSRVRITVEPEVASVAKPYPTVQDWLDSGLIGIWKEREDIEDSTAYVTSLRRQLEEPRVRVDDSD